MKALKGRVQLGHGGGGSLMRELVRDLFAASFAAGGAEAILDDAALLAIPDQVNFSGRLALTTDTFVVSPLFFPGGCVGDLSINGTINDLAMVGAQPLGLSVAMVLEEGLELTTLRKIVASMVIATEKAGVRVVTGDTKVVARGQGDGVYINTSAVGIVPQGIHLSAGNLVPGDQLIVSGPIGDHGVAVMSRRAGLSFEADIVSDSAPLNELVSAMLKVSAQVHALRDPTRGGLAAALNEFAEDSNVAIDIHEEAIPIRPVVRAACETMGFDPLHVPCEGRLLAAVPSHVAQAILDVMRSHEQGTGAAIIGEVSESDRPEVRLHTSVGGARLVDLPAGELLPRIC